MLHFQMIQTPCSSKMAMLSSMLWQLISHRIFDNMLKRINFVFSTDVYQESSTKEMEREACDSSDTLIVGG